MDSDNVMSAALERLSVRDMDSESSFVVDFVMLSVNDRVSDGVIVCVTFSPVAASVN